MKISNQEIRRSVKSDRIHFLVFDELGYFIPKSVKFKLDYFGKSLTIQGISFNDWAKEMLENKLVISSSKVLLPRFFEHIQGGEESVLIVENTEMEYITKTLFKILETILPEYQLNYLEYD